MSCDVINTILHIIDNLTLLAVLLSMLELRRHVIIKAEKEPK